MKGLVMKLSDWEKAEEVKRRLQAVRKTATDLNVEGVINIQLGSDYVCVRRIILRELLIKEAEFLSGELVYLGVDPNA